MSSVDLNDRIPNNMDLACDRRLRRALEQWQPAFLDVYVFDINSGHQYDAWMRTTLTIDDDIAARIEERRRTDGRSLKQVVNQLLREGLRSSERPPEARPYRTKTHKLRLRPGFDAARLNQLVDELETEERTAREVVLRQ